MCTKKCRRLYNGYRDDKSNNEKTTHSSSDFLLKFEIFFIFNMEYGVGKWSD